MKFRSRIDNTFKFIFGSLSLLFAVLIGESFLFMEFSESYVIVFDSIIAFLWIFVIWIFLGTRYKITSNKLIYNSGPFYGRISLSKINKISVNKTLWSGTKVALAKKGIVITYEGGKEIYISPKTNKTFVKHLLEKKTSIEVNYYKHNVLK